MSWVGFQGDKSVSKETVGLQGDRSVSKEIDWCSRRQVSFQGDWSVSKEARHDHVVSVWLCKGKLVLEFGIYSKVCLLFVNEKPKVWSLSS